MYIYFFFSRKPISFIFNGIVANRNQINEPSARLEDNPCLYEKGIALLVIGWPGKLYYIFKNKASSNVISLPSYVL